MLLALLIALVAGRVAFEYVAARLVPNPGDAEAAPVVEALIAPYREDLLHPCIGRFGVMAEPAALLALPAWKDLTSGRSDTFPCSALAGVPTVSTHYSFWLQQYLHRALSVVFRLTGPRLLGLAWFQSAMYAAFIALLFGVFRLGMGRVVSVLLMVPLVVSPRHLEMALAPTEYAKAPFFAGCLLGIGTLVVVPMRRIGALALAAATGVLVGLGFGFKSDVLVYAPFGALALLLFPRPMPHRFREALAITGAFVGAVLVAGLPILTAHFGGSQRSLLPVQVLGGMSPGFSDQYATPALYDYGVIFDDDYVTAQINSFNQRVNGANDFGLFFTTTLQRGATDLVLALGRTFPADFLLRTYAAVLQVLQFVPAGALIALGVWVGLCRSDRRLALFVLFTLLFMVGYVSLVFAPKHYFHLEFVPWWFAGVFVSGAVSRLGGHRNRGVDNLHVPALPWSAVAIQLIVVAMVAGGLLLALRAYQSRHVGQLVEAYLEPSRLEPLPLQEFPGSASSTLVVAEGVALPVTGPAPSEDGAAAPVFSAPGVNTQYLALRVECLAPRTGSITAVYRRPIRWRHPFDVPCENEHQRWTVMWPVYQHLPHQAFRGFELGGDSPLRIAAIERVRNVRDYPILVRLRLPDNWASRARSQQLNAAALSPWRVRPMQAALSHPVPPLPPPPSRWDPPFIRGAAPLATEAPPLTKWSPVGGVLVAPQDSGVIVNGDDSQFGYQLLSPPIPVRPHSKIAVRVYGDVEQGRVAFGILNGDGQRWLMPAVWGRSDFEANTGDNDRIVMVFANYRQPSDGDITSRFRIRSVSFDLKNGGLDRIQRMLWPVSE